MPSTNIRMTIYVVRVTMYASREAFSLPAPILIFLRPSFFLIQVAKDSLSSNFGYRNKWSFQVLCGQLECVMQVTKLILVK